MHLLPLNTNPCIEFVFQEELVQLSFLFFSRPFFACLVSREQKGPSWQQQQQQWGGLLEPIGRMTRRRKESRKRVTLQLARWNLELANAGMGLVCAVLLLLLPTRPEMPAPPVARDAVLLAPPNQRSHSTLPVTHSLTQSINHSRLGPTRNPLTLSVAATCRLQRIKPGHRSAPLVRPLASWYKLLLDFPTCPSLFTTTST